MARPDSETDRPHGEGICGGTAQITCPDCSGKGCSKCNESGQIPCPGCGACM